MAARIVRSTLLMAALASSAAASVLMQSRRGVAQTSTEHVDHFRGALRALEKDDTQQAISELRSALAMKSEDNRRVMIESGWFERYTPHFFLAKAMAAHSRKDHNFCTGAREQVKLVESSVNKDVVAEVDKQIARNCGT